MAGPAANTPGSPPALKRFALGFPSGIAVNAAGNLLIADSFSNRIRMVTG
jgi:NHL repeat